MKKMLKRADGSKSQRGLWDNIRAKAAANKKAGKKGKAPSKDILEQEAKIKAEMKMGGDWMQDSKELKFGGPSKRKKYQTAGPEENTTSTPKFNFTFSGGDTAGSGKSFGQKQACVGEGCGKVIAGGSSYAGGSGTNYTGPGGAQLSMKPKYKDRIVEKSPEQLAIDKEKYQTAQDTMLAKRAAREARAAENLKAYKDSIAPKEEIKYDFKRVYATDPADPNAKQKTGGKKKKMGGKK